jgi:AcrR family transcriptional regulator
MTPCHRDTLEGVIMPTITFFNLPDGKKDTLIVAAKQEFTRVPLYDASISNIVKEAKIPRGSFYQYFTDKEDLYFYLLEMDAERRRQKIVQNMVSHEGDFFTALIDILRDLLHEMENDKVQSFYRNVFLNMNYKTEKMFMNRQMDTEFNQYFTEIKPLIATDGLNINCEEELFQIVQISTTVMMQNIVWKFAKDLSNEEVIITFTKQLGLLKRGFLR